jgi:hypothetical protein
MAASSAALPTSGYQQGVFENFDVSQKYWNDCCAKDAAPGQPSQTSPRASSAWSTQDGFATCMDPDRDTSLEVCRRHRVWLQGANWDCGSFSLPVSKPSGPHRAPAITPNTLYVVVDISCRPAHLRSRLFACLLCVLLQCVQDIPCPSSWPVALQGRLDQDCDATCTSRSNDLCDKDAKCKPEDGAASTAAEQAAHNDAAAHQDIARKLQQPVSPAEQQRLRAAGQLEDLLSMIRYHPCLLLFAVVGQVWASIVGHI